MERKESEFVRELRVERIVVERNGKEVMEIGSDEHGGRIVIYAGSGTPAIEISVSEGDGLVAVFARAGNIAALISADEANNGYVLLYDETGKPQFGIGVSREGVWNTLISDEALKQIEDYLNR
jgi:class 3 adenylate cyclase